MAATKKSTASYKTLLSSRTFLKVQQRAKFVSGINLISVDYSDFILRFRCNSATTQGLKYDILLSLEQLSPEKVIEAGGKLDAVLRAAKLKVHCNCPAFLYWGFAFKSYKKGYGYYPETRYPIVRNPGLKGLVCKHLFAVMQTYPFWSKTIASKMKKFWTEEQRKQIEDALKVALKGVRV